MYSHIYESIVSAVKSEGFQGGTSEAGAVLVAALAVLLVVFIQLVIVQFLWNAVLVPSTTIARPLKSMIQTLGLLVLVAMILPGK
jgi:hypothetical protein